MYVVHTLLGVEATIFINLTLYSPSYLVFLEEDFAILTLLWPLVQVFSYLTGKVIVRY